MNPGLIWRDRPQFKKKTVTTDTFNVKTDNWDTNATFGDDGKLPAVYEIAGSREFPVAFKRHNETTARFRVRYLIELDYSGAAADYRIIHNGRTWNMSAPYTEKPKGRPRELHLEVSEIS